MHIYYATDKVVIDGMLGDKLEDSTGSRDVARISEFSIPLSSLVESTSSIFKLIMRRHCPQMDSQSRHPENILVLQVLEGGGASIELWRRPRTQLCCCQRSTVVAPIRRSELRSGVYVQVEFSLSLIPERNRSARGSPMNSSRRRAMDSGEKLYPVRAR